MTEQNKSQKVLLAYPIARDGWERLAATPGIEILPQSAVDKPLSDDVLEAALPSADGLITTLTHPVGQDTLALAPHLRAVSTISVGFDHIDVAACAKRGVRVGHTPNVLTDAVADTALILALMVSRRILRAMEVARNGLSPHAAPDIIGSQFAYKGKVAGIVGMGRIGQAIAHRVRALGAVEVVYSSRRDMQLPDARHVSLEELLRTSDTVFLACTLTKETERMIAASQLQLMKRSAILVNIARGKLVDTDALVTALRDGTIAGAGLDVTEPEPLPAGHVLLGAPNCVVLPHIGSATVETRHDMMDLAIDNLIAALAPGHQPMPAEVPAP